MLPDISTRNDIERLMADFYSVALDDNQIGHHFDGMDLAAHMPVIVDFWEKALFAKPVYFGNPLLVHKTLHDKMPLTPEHFNHWVTLFTTAVDRLFSGDVADRAKAQAGRIADSLNQRLNVDI